MLTNFLVISSLHSVYLIVDDMLAWDSSIYQCSVLGCPVRCLGPEYYWIQCYYFKSRCKFLITLSAEKDRFWENKQYLNLWLSKTVVWGLSNAYLWWSGGGRSSMWLSHIVPCPSCLSILAADQAPAVREPDRNSLCASHMTCRVLTTGPLSWTPKSVGFFQLLWHTKPEWFITFVLSQSIISKYAALSKMPNILSHNNIYNTAW